MFKDLKNEDCGWREKKNWFVWNFKENRNCNKNLLQDLECVKKEFVRFKIYINKNQRIVIKFFLIFEELKKFRENLIFNKLNE